MTYKFLINDAELIPCSKMEGVTGNVNTYTCEFEIHQKKGLLNWFCVFKTGENAYVVPVEDGRCQIPFEVLINAGILEMGCYAISADEADTDRISTNLVQFNIQIGAYGDATSPEEPTPEFWETIVLKAAPHIGENGNWYIYDIGSASYIDSGVVAVGKDGYTPVRGVDFWTDKDRQNIKAYIDECTAEIDEKEDKSQVLEDAATNYTFEFLALANKEIRLGAAESISFDFGVGEYPEDYVAGLSFDSGETPTSIYYTNSGILNWIGTDCAMRDGVSVFEPSANVHYDVVIYYNGTQFVGMVNGFVKSAEQNAE